MKDANTLIEYGAPIDAQAMVTPTDTTELELEPGHPGRGDEGYIRRRKELFALCRRHRLERLTPRVHARAGHDPRLPGPRAAADEPRLCRAAHAGRQGRGDDPAWRPGAGTQALQLVQHRIRLDRGGGRN